ncbi:MAG: formate dehydrogenase subunit alpha [Candidatus Methylomirabilis oxyfera]|nr:formate dehydrogenase subunit alpha [Candidatus Methylomirabilis oxyfera]
MGDTLVSLTINGTSVAVEPGATVLDAVNRLGLPLPQLCKDPDRPALGACRTCLVKVEGMRGFPASCHLPAREGMIVSTNDPDLTQIRNEVLDLTCGMATPSLDRPGFGQLSDACARLGLFQRRHMPWRHTPVDDSKSFFVLDRDACILCGRCTVACDDVQQIGAIALLGRSSRTKVGVFDDGSLASSVCTSCGQCVATCPTGAIRPKEWPAAIVREVETTCPYCGVGCGITLRVRADGRLAVMAEDAPDNQSSLGMLCVKGRFGTGFVHAPDRITRPMIRNGGRWRDVSWDEALDAAAEGIARNRGRFGALASAKATNEESYIVQKFVRTVMATNNIDHCARLCHSPSVVAMLRSLGSGATSNSYDDYEEAGCLMVVGSDPSSNHPVIAVRLRQAVSRGARLIVVNPKRIELCDQADLWLRQRPGTDVTLFNAMAKVIVDQGLANLQFVQRRTEGFETWRKSLEAYILQFAEQVTGVPQEQIVQAARWYAKPAFSGSCLLWGMGVTQHTNGTANAHALLNLSLVAGQMGFAGSGISPLRGQNNVQGCGDAGCLPTHLPGYQRYTSEVIEKFEAAWGIRLPHGAGMMLTEMVDRCLEGSIRAMYMVGENPLLTEPDLHHAKRALSNLDCLVVQELFLHETAELAHVFLPTAAFAEKEGTFTNSERRVQRVRKALDPPGEARPDWWITSELARRVADKFGVSDSRFSYTHPAEIFDEMARLVPFLSGISYERLEREGGIQWPCPTSDHPGTRLLYAESFPIGKAQFVPVLQTAEAAELPDHDFPFLLNTGRILYHWHGGTLTRRVQGLLELAPRLEVAINPDDARRLALDEGTLVRLTSRRGELTAYAQITEAVRAGEVFIPFVKLAESGANILTNSAYDPSAKIPEYKVCAVKIERVGT